MELFKRFRDLPGLPANWVNFGFHLIIPGKGVFGRALMDRVVTALIDMEKFNGILGACSIGSSGNAG